MNSPATNSKVFWPMPSACVAMNWLPCVSAAATRRCTVSKSPSPKRVEQHVDHAAGQRVEQAAQVLRRIPLAGLQPRVDAGRLAGQRWR